MFPSSFAFQPRAAFSPLALQTPFQSATPSSDFDFDAYDAHRTALEQRALAAKQQERRAAETDALRRQRQQEALYTALARRQAEEDAYAAAVAQHRRREQARVVAAREAAHIAEMNRRRAAATTAQAQAQAQEHRRRLATAQQSHREAHQRDSNPIHPLQSFFEQLLDASLETSESAEPAPAPAPLPVPSATPTPAPTAQSIETTNEASMVLDDEATLEAATTLQRHFRAHLARRTALASLATLASSLVAQQSAFVPPPALVFQSSNSGSTSTAPKLAFSPVNAPFLAHEDFLVGLLTKVDAVQSGGDKVVKTARKDLVRKIELELRRLDELKDGEWEKLSTGEPDKSADQDVERSDDAAPLSTDPALTTDDATAALADTSPADTSDALEGPTPIPSSINTSEKAEFTSNSLDFSSSGGAPSTPLTPAALASVPSTRRPRTATSDSDSTDTDSTIAIELGDEFLDEIIKLAGKFGSKSKCARRPRLAGREGFAWV